ncbi:MAG: hypothetical protein Ta2E_01690 [Mycoplasmoidaceae bacterium]|nr:MAG: hypothetical protein Ta2E_01690 [Mycoplasmoidaceae bacterium]
MNLMYHINMNLRWVSSSTNGKNRASKGISGYEYFIYLSEGLQLLITFSGHEFERYFVDEDFSVFPSVMDLNLES